MLALKTLLGAGWTVSSRLSGRLVDFLMVLVLARMLTPADFGLVALAMTIVATTNVVLELPLFQALTRLRRMDKSHQDTAFTLGLLRGLVFGAILLCASVPFAWFYEEPRLVPVIAVLAIAPLAYGLQSPGMVTFIRDLAFRRTFIVEFSGKVGAALVTLVLVHAGVGYWAIVANSVLSPLFASILSYCVTSYRPALSLARVGDFTSFIGWFSAAQLFSALNWQLDRFLLARFVSRAELGQYAMSNDLSVLPTQSLIGPAMQPVMAAFATISHDAARMKTAFLKVSRLTMLLATPVCVGISLTADLFVPLLLGPKWIETGELLRWLSLPIFFNAYLQPLYSAALATDRPETIFRLNVAELVLRIGLTGSLLWLFGLYGVVASRGLASAVMFVVYLRAAQRLIGVGYGAQLRNLWQVAFAAFGLAAAVLALRRWGLPEGLGTVSEFAVSVATGVLAYAGCLLLTGIRPRSLL